MLPTADARCIYCQVKCCGSVSRACQVYAEFVWHLCRPHYAAAILCFKHPGFACWFGIYITVVLGLVVQLPKQQSLEHASIARVPHIRGMCASSSTPLLELCHNQPVSITMGVHNLLVCWVTVS